jgi:hypothetical protein
VEKELVGIATRLRTRIAQDIPQEAHLEWDVRSKKLFNLTTALAVDDRLSKLERVCVCHTSLDALRAASRACGTVRELQERLLRTRDSQTPAERQKIYDCEFPR